MASPLATRADPSDWEDREDRAMFCGSLISANVHVISFRQWLTCDVGPETGTILPHEPGEVAEEEGDGSAEGPPG